MHLYLKIALLVILPLLFIGCSQKAEPKYTYKPPLLPLIFTIDEDGNYDLSYDPVINTPFGDVTKKKS